MRANKMLLYGNSCKGSTVWNPFLNGATCPPTVRYPQPPCPTETLFIGWNPPGTRHFWNSQEDKLRNSLGEVLWQLAWNRQGDFIQQFLSQHCYLVHAVPCWQKVKFPDGEFGTKLVSLCTQNLLKPTLATIQPKRICALGKVPHIALHNIWLNDIPAPNTNFRYSAGWHGQAGPYEIIITCFPNTWPVDSHNPKGPKNRDCTVAALRRWWHP